MTTKQPKKAPKRGPKPKSPPSPAALDTQVRRKANLAILVGRMGGNHTKLAEELEVHTSQITHWLGSRSITEMAAREIETKMGLGVGWMDRGDNAGVVLASKAFSVVREALTEAGARIPPDKQDEFFGLACDLIQALGTPANDVIHRVARLMK